jgi:toxin FitB
MIVLDTNVLSELAKPDADPNVKRWHKTFSPASLFISCLSVTELRYGAALLPEGVRREKLNRALDYLLVGVFKANILPFDTKSAEICANLMVERRAYAPIPKIVDLQIAATALAHGFAVATRDVNDFSCGGLRVINPWTD